MDRSPSWRLPPSRKSDESAFKTRGRRTDPTAKRHPVPPMAAVSLRRHPASIDIVGALLSESSGRGDDREPGKECRIAKKTVTTQSLHDTLRQGRVWLRPRWPPQRSDASAGRPAPGSAPPQGSPLVPTGQRGPRNLISHGSSLWEMNALRASQRSPSRLRTPDEPRDENPTSIPTDDDAGP
jgi:hypothetical protein